MAYADDIFIIGRALASTKEGFQLLEEVSKEVGLVIDEGKTKYMVAANTQIFSKPHAIQIGRYSFERVDSYTYLGSLVNGDNNVSEEITNRFIAANRSYFGLKSQFKSQSLSRKTKILIYTALVKTKLTYAAETWTYLLTPWCRVLLEKLTGLQLVKKFPAFHGTRRFITTLTSVRHPYLSWANPIQSTYPLPTS